MGVQNQGSIVVNGQLVSQAPIASQYVTGYMPYSPLGSSFPLTIPPTVGGSGVNTGTLTPTADSNAQAAQNAANDPFNPKVSPLIPALLALAFALFMLHEVHFRSDGASSTGE
jgi:hypothetical protein